MATKNEMLWRLEVNDPQRFTEWRPLWAFGDDQLAATQALAVELNRRGIEVARRTVAKYREALNIPSSNERSRFG